MGGEEQSNMLAITSETGVKRLTTSSAQPKRTLPLWAQGPGGLVDPARGGRERLATRPAPPTAWHHRPESAPMANPSGSITPPTCVFLQLNLLHVASELALSCRLRFKLECQGTVVNATTTRASQSMGSTFLVSGGAPKCIPRTVCART